MNPGVPTLKERGASEGAVCLGAYQERRFPGPTTNLLSLLTECGPQICILTRFPENL